jgi:hypothetical protein
MITTFSTPPLASSCADAAARVVVVVVVVLHVRCVRARALCRRRRLTSVVPLKACTTPERVVVDIARRRCLLLGSDDIHTHARTHLPACPRTHLLGVAG